MYRCLGWTCRLRLSFFWYVTQRWLVVSYWRFGKTYRSHLQGSRGPRKIYPSRWEWWVTPEKSVTNYSSTEERISRLHHGGSPKSRNLPLVSYSTWIQHSLFFLLLSFLSLTLSGSLTFRPPFRLSFFPSSFHLVCWCVHNASPYLRIHDPSGRQTVGSSTSQADNPGGRGSVALRLISLNHATTRKELSHAHTWEETGAVSPVMTERQPPTRTRHLAVGLQTHSIDFDEISYFRSARNTVDKYNFRSYRDNVVTTLYTKIEWYCISFPPYNLP